MRRSAAVLVMMALLAFGCAARHRLTAPGALVREGPPEIRGSGECDFLEVVHASNRPPIDNVFVEDQTTELYTIIRNKTAELGGNVFIVVASERYEAQAEVYRCVDEQDPQTQEEKASITPKEWLERCDVNGNERVTCVEARATACGAPIPMTRDHPLYQFMRDGDGDGRVCE